MSGFGCPALHQGRWGRAAGCLNTTIIRVVDSVIQVADMSSGTKKSRFSGGQARLGG